MVLSVSSKYLPFVAIVVFLLCRNVSRKRQTGGITSPPVWGPWYIPPFVRGLVAMIKLGQDEDAFLLSAKAQYGDCVYVPWPMAQVLVLGAKSIQHVYAKSKKESFYTIRSAIQNTAFGTPQHYTSNSAFMLPMYATHAKAMNPTRFSEPVSMFVEYAQARVEQLAKEVDARGGVLEINLVRWVRDCMFASASYAFFGEELTSLMSSGDLIDGFYQFDEIFGLLASDMIPPWLQHMVPSIRKGLAGRDALQRVISKWLASGAPGLDDTSMSPIRMLVDHGKENNLSPDVVATFLFAELWALQANAPWAAATLLLHVIQSPVLPDVVEEIDRLPVRPDGLPQLDPSTLDSMELATSCVHETIRLWTSSFSIRVIPEPLLLPGSAPFSNNQQPDFAIPANSKVICATRASHLTDGTFGESPQEWDGRRFMRSKGDANDELRVKKLRNVWGFGGGVSICEGRHFASHELRALLSLLLSTFEFTPLYATEADGRTPINQEHPRIAILGGKYGIGATKAVGRIGLGAFQYSGESDVIVRISRRRRA